jgi:integrase
MAVKQQTHVVPRGADYQFRMSVPVDLIGHYGPKSGDIRKTLGKDLTKAKAEARRLVVHYEAEFEAARRRLTAKPVPLTAELVPLISKSLEAHMLRADEEGRIEGADADEFEVRATWAAAELETLKKAYARGGTEPVSAILDDWLVGLGIAANPESDTYKLLRRRVMEARIRSLQGVNARNEGDIVETPDALTPASLQQTLIDESATIAPTVPKRRSAGHRLADVVKYWKGTTAKSLRSEVAADGLVREFVELHGDLPLRDIEKSHFVALRDAMLKRVKPATVQARFNLLKAAYTTCLEDDKLGVTASPLQHVKIRGVDTGEKSRDAFTADQLQVIFDAPVFAKGDRPIGGRGEAAFWGPLLAMFTGARLNELLSLRIDGVYEWEGVPVIHFRHRPELGQLLKGKVKNNRRVPVHSELIRLGFLDYVRSVKGRGPWLFPDIDRGTKARSHSSAWGAWFGRYLRHLGIKDKKLTFHSFRHTFKHFARASNIPEDHHDAMTGHVSAEVARRYGSAEGYPVVPLAGSVAALKFGTLDLSRIG